MCELARLPPTTALLAFVIFAAIGGCDAFYQVRGKVRSCHDQNPIAGANVELTYPGEHGAAKTDETGTFRVAANDLPGENPATLTVEAPGYLRAERTVHHSYEESQDVCLQPAKGAPGNPRTPRRSLSYPR